MLERCRCETSLNQDVGLSRFVMLELNVSQSKLRRGLTHSACNYVYVMNCFRFDELVAVYKVMHTNHWYYKTIVPLQIFKSGSLFNEPTSGVYSGG